MDSNTRRSRNCVRMTTRLGVMHEKEHDFANASSRACELFVRMYEQRWKYPSEYELIPPFRLQAPITSNRQISDNPNGHHRK